MIIGAVVLLHIKKEFYSNLGIGHEKIGPIWNLYTTLIWKFCNVNLRWTTKKMYFINM
jgi:hypothetical protein